MTIGIILDPAFPPPLYSTGTQKVSAGEPRTLTTIPSSASKCVTPAWASRSCAAALTLLPTNEAPPLTSDRQHARSAQIVTTTFFPSASYLFPLQLLPLPLASSSSPPPAAAFITRCMQTSVRPMDVDRALLSTYDLYLTVQSKVVMCEIAYRFKFVSQCCYLAIKTGILFWCSTESASQQTKPTVKHWTICIRHPNINETMKRSGKKWTLVAVIGDAQMVKSEILHIHQFVCRKSTSCKHSQNHRRRAQQCWVNSYWVALNGFCFDSVRNHSSTHHRWRSSENHWTLESQTETAYTKTTTK